MLADKSPDRLLGALFDFVMDTGDCSYNHSLTLCMAAGWKGIDSCLEHGCANGGGGIRMEGECKGTI